MHNSEIKYEKGWRNKFRFIWDEVKLTSMCYSGWNRATLDKKSQAHNKGSDYMQILAFRGIATEEGLYHVRAGIYYDAELYDGEWEASCNLNQMIKYIDAAMQKHNEIFVEIHHETWDLEDKQHDCTVHIFKDKEETK